MEREREKRISLPVERGSSSRRGKDPREPRMGIRSEMDLGRVNQSPFLVDCSCRLDRPASRVGLISPRWRQKETCRLLFYVQNLSLSAFNPFNPETAASLKGIGPQGNYNPQPRDDAVSPLPPSLGAETSHSPHLIAHLGGRAKQDNNNRTLSQEPRRW